MKFLGSFSLLCTLIFGGAMASNRSGGWSGERRGPGRDNAGQNCMETCQAEEKCPTSAIIRMKFESQSQECRECIAEDCGEMGSSIRRLDEMKCRGDAYMECEECPPLSMEEQTQMRNCRQCLRNCSFKSGGRPRLTPGRGPGGFNPVRAVFGVFRCMSSCEAPNRCPRRGEHTFVANQECRQCIRSACGSEGEPDRSCVYEARSNCEACPVRSDEEQGRMRNCMSCIRNCAPVRGPSGGRNRRPPFLVMRPFQRLSCMRRCRAESTCPAMDEMMAEVEGSSQGCKDCLFEECGYFNRFNRSEVADCIATAKLTCTGCPAMTSVQQMRMKGCKACARQCFSGSPPGPPRGPPRLGHGRGGHSMRSFRHISCIMSCEGPTMCPSAGEVSGLITMSQGECRECVEEECGELNRSNLNERADCALRARRDCDSCTPTSNEQRGRIRNCSSCVRNCFGRESRPGPPSAMRNPRPLGRFLCIRDCRSPTTCPAREEVMNNFRELRQECRSCIRENCGSVDEANLSSKQDCVMAARLECSECPTMSSQQQMRERSCRSCLQRCANLGNDGDRDRRVYPAGPRIFGRLSCMRNCQSPEKCPRIEEIRSNIMATRMECRECLVEECGEFDRSNRSDVAECLMEARQDCEECPTLSDRDQTRRRKCMSCVRGCLPFQGKALGRHRRFPRRPLQLLSCMRGCALNNQCPRREEFMNRFRNTPKACRDCVMDECGSVMRGNPSELADCIDEERESCPECPDRDPEDQERRRTCRSCVKTCVARNDRCDASDENETQDQSHSRPGQSSSPSERKGSCMRSCESPTACPSVGHQTQLPAACMTCIQQRNCRHTAGSNPLSAVQCLMRSRQTCPMCPDLNLGELTRIRACTSCVANCLRSSPSSSGGTRPGGMGPGGPRQGGSGPRGPRPGNFGPGGARLGGIGSNRPRPGGRGSNGQRPRGYGQGGPRPSGIPNGYQSG